MRLPDFEDEHNAAQWPPSITPVVPFWVRASGALLRRPKKPVAPPARYHVEAVYTSKPKLSTDWNVGGGVYFQAGS